MSNTTTIAKEPRPHRTTFGVELEFLVPYLLDTQEDPLEAEGKAEGLAPLFRISDNETRPDIQVRNAIAKLFQDHGLETQLKRYEYTSDYARRALEPYSYWQVKEDITVKEDDDSTPWLRKYGWVDVEITSPVEPAIPAAYEVLNYARELLTKTYRCRVNSSCGLHVHVGKGAERFDLGNLRRIAALTWASEHLFVNLNHPSRRANAYTPTLRERTAIARGRGGGGHDEGEWGSSETCVRYLGQDVRHGEEAISWRDQFTDPEIREAFDTTRREGHYEPFQWKSGEGQSHEADVPIDPRGRNVDEEIENRIAAMIANANIQHPTDTREPCRKRTMPKMVNVRYTPKQLEDLAEANGIHPIDFLFTGKTPGVYEGVKQLYDSPSSCDISWLMYPRGRGYVNFNHYDCASLQWSAREQSEGAKRAIEFRGAEGSLDSWVVTWTKICVGMIRFALYSPVEEFCRVLEKCDNSDREVEQFDCIDFLDEIGLPAEAVLAERHLKENEVAFGVKYVEEEKSSEGTS